MTKLLLNQIYSLKFVYILNILFLIIYKSFLKGKIQNKDTIEKFILDVDGQVLQLKWPNDLILNKFKCGVRCGVRVL